MALPPVVISSKAPAKEMTAVNAANTSDEYIVTTKKALKERI